MNIETLKDIPPWDWPQDAGTIFLRLLSDRQGTASDRLLAAELAGDFTVVNDELAEALLAIVQCGDETEALRETAALSLGVTLEHADTMGFEDADDILISEATFQRLQQSLHHLFRDAEVPPSVRRGTGRSTQPGRTSPGSSPRRIPTNPCGWRRLRRPLTSVRKRQPRYSP